MTCYHPITGYIQIQHLLMLNSIITLIGNAEKITDSNTTLVNVKFHLSTLAMVEYMIQIQHLLMLNACPFRRTSCFKQIQIQHLLMLN